MADNGLFSNLTSGNLWGAAASLIPTIFKGIKSIGQKNEANKINPTNPGYAMNEAVIDNARVLGERASNYQLPGYGQAVQGIENAGATAFNNGVQGASSSGDVLDLAAKIAYGNTKRLNDLAITNAQGTDNALMQSLDANALAGQEYVKKNAYERDEYEKQLRRKAALNEGSAQNAYGALDTGATVLGSLLNTNATGGPPSTGGLNPSQTEAFYKYMAKQKTAGV